MDDEARDKFLSKLIGEEPFVCIWCGTSANQRRLPVACSAPDGDGHLFKVANINFSTWEGFGKLWEWAQKQKWWPLFIAAQHKRTPHKMHEEWVWLNFIHPDAFANAIWKFLKENQP